MKPAAFPVPPDESAPRWIVSGKRLSPAELKARAEGVQVLALGAFQKMPPVLGVTAISGEAIEAGRVARDSFDRIHKITTQKPSA